MSELKPCPLCGGHSEIILDSVEVNQEKVDSTGEVNVEINASIYAKCDVCGLRSRLYKTVIWIHPNGETEICNDGAKETAETWNRRADN